MKNKANPLRVVQEVLHHAQQSQEAKHERVSGTGLSPQMARLREFQCERIAQTYRDFAAQPQYAPVMQFFLEDLYGARDYTQRDYDAARVHNFLKKFVPAEMLKLVTDAIELTQLSHTLDEKLLWVLIQELDFRETLTPELYAEAYRRCDNADERERQIELLVGVMHDAATVAHFPLTGVGLRMAKGPMHAAGWHEMYAFLERGQQAFSKVKKPEKFLEAIQERETEIMDKIARGVKNPFQ